MQTATTRQRRWVALALVAMSTATTLASAPFELELVSVKKIWDQAPHNAFTDLIRWNEQFYCAFREGRSHVSTDGRIRVLCSKDADAWTPTGLIALDGYDLRDAHLSVTPDDRLMLLGGAAPREKDNQNAPTGSFVAFSKDGTEWTKPQIVVKPGRWLWCVTWYKGKAYGVSYPAPQGTAPYLELLASDDGIAYQPLVYKLYGVGRPGEVTLRFDASGTCYALIRRDQLADQPCSAILGISRGDYTQWQWHDLGPEFNAFGGPNLIQLPTGHGSTEPTEVWLAAGRMHQDGAHTALCYLDVINHTMTKLLKLPSGGDTSYPGLVWHNDLLYVSYYSSHEGKTSIYLARIKIVMKQSAMRECPSVDAADYYFPFGVLDSERPNMDEFIRNWYSKHLRAMQEPSLSCGTRTAEFTYRFLWLRTFHHPISVRIEKEGSSTILHAVELDGTGGSAPGKPLRQIHRTLSPAEQERLMTRLKKTWYWGTPRYIVSGGLDGAEWILEGAQNGQYQIMKEWSPRVSIHRDACLLFLELAGFSIPAAEIY